MKDPGKSENGGSLIKGKGHPSSHRRRTPLRWILIGGSHLGGEVKLYKEGGDLVIISS